jgi:hypothetical protein
MTTWTNVSKLEVIIETGQTRCNIYGNSRNMIGVVVSIQPTDEQGKPVHVDPYVLFNSTQLIDYVDETTFHYQGSSDWCYTDKPNEFNTIPGVTRAAALQMKDGIPQVKFYVYCYDDARVRTKTIGVQVRTSSGNLIKSSQNGTYHSSVQLAALTPISYNSQNTRLEREDTATGSYWNQDNYYFTISTEGLNIIRADISGAPSGPEIWSIISKDQRPNWHFIWKFGPKNTATAFDIPLTYNQRPHAVCLTRLYRGDYNSEYQNLYFETRFTVYDQYGNGGLFSAVRNESDWGNTIYVAEGDHTSKG